MDSKELAKTWGTPLDILFIDGDHTYGGCKGDIEGFYPHVRKGGYIAIHDYDKESLEFTDSDPHPKPLSGVTKAVDDTLPQLAVLYDRVQSLIVYRK
jgi:hypothetical protein